MSINDSAFTIDSEGAPFQRVASSASRPSVQQLRANLASAPATPPAVMSPPQFGTAAPASPFTAAPVQDRSNAVGNLRANLGAFAPRPQASFTTARPTGAIPNLSTAQWRPASLSAIGQGPLQPAPHIAPSMPVPSGLLTASGSPAPRQGAPMQAPAIGDDLQVHALPPRPTAPVPQAPSGAGTRPRTSFFPTAPSPALPPTASGGASPVMGFKTAALPSAVAGGGAPAAPATPLTRSAQSRADALAGHLATPAGRLLAKAAVTGIKGAGKAVRHATETARQGGGALPTSTGWLKR